jgi:hypothetical protein
MFRQKRSKSLKNSWQIVNGISAVHAQMLASAQLLQRRYAAQSVHLSLPVAELSTQMHMQR